MSEKTINPNLNILLADDTPKITQTLSAVLKSAGFKNLFFAENGREALEVLREHGIDLVFMDWDMPEMTGREVLRRMQEEKMLTYTKVIMLTAFSEKEYIMDAMDHGASNYIVKPFTPPVIYKKIESVFHAELLSKKDFLVI